MAMEGGPSIDFVVPDVPEKLRVRLHRDEWKASAQILAIAVTSDATTPSPAGA